MKKQNLKKVLIASFVGATAFTLASCGGNTNIPTTDNPSVNPDNPSVNPDVNPSVPDVEESLPTIPIPSVDNNKNVPFTPENYAHGAKSYVAHTYQQRTEILGLLEKYAVDNNLTGLTLFGDGGYVMYSPDILKGTNSYIPGYGFGILGEGDIIKDLASESNPNWKRYLHSVQSEDPMTVNGMNDTGSVVSDLLGNIAGSYFINYMNEDKDGYEWGAGLANENRPRALNPDPKTGLATKYRVEVKTGSNQKYTTFSKVPEIAAFNNREVKLEDYLTPYKLLYTKANAMARGGENLEGPGSFVGVKEYYDKTANGFDKDLWDKVGIKAYEKNGKSYLEFEFNVPCNTFYAMYYLAGSNAAPIPYEFLETLGKHEGATIDNAYAKGVAAFGNYTDKKLSPVDTYLSTGPYAIEAWNQEQEIVFKRNPNYNEGANNHKGALDGRYNIKGVHYKILKSMKEDPEAVFKEFELSKSVHSCGIPRTKLAEYKNDPRATQTKDSSTFKLNMNTCTPELWEQLFGVNGTVTQTPENKYWKVEPAMSNKDFIKGLSYSIDRTSFAESLGRTPSANFFGSGYLSDPENGVSYNSTEEHKKATAGNEGTKDGYNLEYARASFKKASEKLIADGVYNEGDTIEIEIAWQNPGDEDVFHNPVKKYMEDAFNSCGGGLKLNVTFWAGAQWDMVYNDKMMVGQFDIGFGSISGNSLNPLSFLEVLKSDNSSHYTLNWGADTNVVSKDLLWDGMYWSFDSLWEAADRGGFFKDGVVSQILEVADSTDQVTVNADGTTTIKVKTTINEGEDVSFKITGAVVFGQTGDNYEEEACKMELAKDGTLTITLTAEQTAKYKAHTDRIGFDLYCDQTLSGISGVVIKTVMFKFPADSAAA